MEMKDFFTAQGEKPLDRIVTDGGFCGILRKIACIGDSLSSGEFESLDEKGNKGYHDYYEYSWGKYMERDIGGCVYNFSRGGMTAKEYCELFADQKDFWNIDYRCQAYIIALGVNDATRMINGELEMGSAADVDFGNWKNNKETFAGFYAQIIQRYKKIQPKAKFFLMTIPRESVEEQRQKLYDEHRELLLSLAEKFENCYVLDFRKYAPIYDEEFHQNFYLGGHLNAAGYRLTALMVESYIDYIIRSHMEDFKQIGFVGTPYHNSGDKW